MKTLISILIVFFLSLELLALDFTEKEKEYINSREVKVAMLPDFPPFSTYSNANLSGYSYDILQLISKKSGLKIEYEIDKWPNNLKKFKNKEVDIIDAISYRENRLEFTDYLEPYYEVPLVIFSRKELNDYTGLESLKGKVLGNTKNIFYKKQVEDLNIFEIKEYNSFRDKLNALAFGDVDVIFGHLLSTQISIEKKGYTNLKVLGELNLPNLKKTDLRFGITKGNETLYSIVNKSFKAITKEEWKELHLKWISVYTKEKSPTIKKIVLTKNEEKFLNENRIDCVLTKDWAPFYLREDKKLVGISMDFWNMVKEKTGIKSECRSLSSFTQVLDLIKEKKSDITISTTITKDKQKFGKFTVPYASYPIAIATTSDKRFISNTSSLNGKKVAVGKSYSAYFLLKDKYPDINFVQVKNNLEALKLLSKGEVFAVVDILPVLSHMIGSYGFKNIKISGTTEFNFDVRMMIRDDYEQLLPILNKAINSITQKESNEIKSKWLSVKVEKVVDFSKLWEIIFIVFVVLIILFYRQYVLNLHNRRLQEANNEIEIKTIELQKKTKQLAKQKELFEKIYYESSDGIYLLNYKNRKIIDCNNMAFKLLGYKTKEEFLTSNYNDFFPVSQPNGFKSIEKLDEMYKIAFEEGSHCFEWVYKKTDGEKIWLEVVLTSINIDDQDIIHVVWRNIDDRKRLEQELNSLTHNLEDKVKEEVRKNDEKTKQLIQQSRLAQMGEMLSMIAHQWRQPLSAISATTNNLLLRIMINKKFSNEELKDEISLISNYSQHLSTTIDDFRNFFKADKQKSYISIEEIIDSSIQIVKSSLESKSIVLTKEYNCNEKNYLYANEIAQVILNILKNAEDILVENRVDKAKIKIKTYNENDYCITEICDNAGGVSQKIIDKIFDPYFSTKKEKEGTGLGLYMSKIIINEHCNGKLSVKNDEFGAVFKIEIPSIKIEDI